MITRHLQPVPEFTPAALSRMTVLADDAARTMRKVGAITATMHRKTWLTLRWGFASPRLREVLLAGLEGRYYVRGGLHPAHSSRAGIDALVQSILAGTADDECLHLRSPERIRCAMAALEGWVRYHDGPAPVMAWHRLMGSTSVSVGRAG